MKKLLHISVAVVGLMVAGCDGISPPEGADPVERKMTVTGYCACGRCCSWRRNWRLQPVFASGPNRGKKKEVGLTASGTRVRYGTIAADTSRYPFGTVMYVEGYGFGVVEDRGGKIKGERIDLYFPSHRQAMTWGKQQVQVKVWFLPKR